MSASILVVEDEPKVLDFVQHILQNVGYRVSSAPNGTIALATLRAGATKVDLLVTDLHMPGIHGKTLADIGRRLDPALKVLYLTGYAGDLFVDQQVLDEGTAFLEKPFSSKGLCQAVRLLLSGSLTPDGPGTFEDAAPLATEHERVKTSLASGATARLVTTGENLAASDVDEIIEALRRYARELEKSSESEPT